MIRLNRPPAGGALTMSVSQPPAKASSKELPYKRPGQERTAVEAYGCVLSPLVSFNRSDEILQVFVKLFGFNFG
jgi:hypothetical protein